MKKILALAAALALVLTFSARSANAQAITTPPVVVDRTAFTLTYTPTLGTSTFDAAVSYRFGPAWDLLVSYTSAPAGLTAFRAGGRYHLRAPSPQVDLYATVQYFSPSTGASYASVGGGFTQAIAPGLKTYIDLNYNFAAASFISGNIGVQYDLSRQLALVAGYDLWNVWGYLGVSYDFTAR